MNQIAQRKCCTVQTFALEHDISTATVWRLIKRGELRTIRMGHRVLVWLSNEPPPSYTEPRGTLLDAR
jgi:hypothetical protein